MFKSDYIRIEGSLNSRKPWIKYIVIFLILSAAFGIGIIVGFYLPKWISTYNFNFNLISKKLQNEVCTTFMNNQLYLYSSQVHQSGSVRNLELAVMMENNWKKWGLQSVRTMEFQVNKTVVDIKNPNIVTIINQEKILDTLNTIELNGTLPVYASYSKGGHARGRSVFVNYGLFSDLVELDKLNITYCGSRIVPIVRFGFSVRSAKVKNLLKKCGKNPPAGLLIYPDPWDFSVDPNNNFSTPENTPVFPDSWWLPGDAAVFGNFKMEFETQNPELPSIEGVFKTVDFSKFQTSFPVQPISYIDAKKIFNHHNEVPIPESWKNCLPKYVLSSEAVNIEMIIKNRVEPVIMSNVIGMIPGVVEKDRYVILGNHRDAWVMGSSDPGSGTVILQQVAFILGQAYKNGIFKPYRSVLFASWDGEEEGLIGSSEFTNQFTSDLSQRCIAYVNMDCPIKGNWSFNGRATPLMIGPMLESAKNVWINSLQKSLFDDWLTKMPESSQKKSTEPKVSFLGGGSDHIPFSYVLGIPSAYPEYKFKESLANMPAYHTSYDNIEMMLKWIDSNLEHHKIVSQFVIDYILRFSCSPRIPYSIDKLVDLLLFKFSDLKNQIDSIPYLKQSNYSDIIKNQLFVLNETVHSFSLKVSSMKNLEKNLFKLRQINDILLVLPRMFLANEGLPLRPYLKNILLSTKLQNSYEGSIFTGVYDAIELFHVGKLNITIVLRQLSLLSNSLRKTNDWLEGGIISIFD